MTLPQPGQPRPSGGSHGAGEHDLEAYVEGVRSGDRVWLGRALTLVESSLDADRLRARALLERLADGASSSERVGVTGPPGVGKSTFIDAFGTHLTGLGHRVAVLAVDPSSSRTGGSILGDKTRMPTLARDPRAFIRPSPSRGSLGGVTARTRQAMAVCEAAGYDVVLVETVGVGQSEVAVAHMVDCFLVLAQPGGGDALQGMKRGILENADLLAVTKADGDVRPRAELARREYETALRLLTPETSAWAPRVLMCSALERTGLEALWSAVEAHRAAMQASGGFAARRRSQRVAWMWEVVREELFGRLQCRLRDDAAWQAVEAQVRDGVTDPDEAAAHLVVELLGRTP